MIGAPELNSFLANPTRYAEGKDLPSALPIRRSAQEAKSMFPKALQLRGYCPVTLKNGKEGLVLYLCNITGSKVLYLAHMTILLNTMGYSMQWKQMINF